MDILARDCNHEFILKVINQTRYPRGNINIVFEDGIERMPIQVAMLHAVPWEILTNFNMPILKRHYNFKLGTPVSTGAIMKIITMIYMEVISSKPDQVMIDKLKDEIFEAINRIDNFGCFELNEYNCSIDLIGLSKIHEHPKIQEIIGIPIQQDLGTAHIEKELASKTLSLIKLLSDRTALEDNILLDYMETGMVNKNQLPQVLISYGLRTEVNDKIIDKLIEDSALSGITSVANFALETQAARKSTYYQKTAIRTSQYNNRVIQIACSILEHLYKGDCGSTKVVRFDVTKSNKNSIIGRNILENGKLIELLPSNIDEYIDRSVYLRTPFGCKHTDGCCETCYGLLGVYNLPKGMNIGTTASTEFISKVSQLVLSTKHFIKTLTKLYQLSEEGLLYFERGTNGIYFNNHVSKSKVPLKLGIFTNNIRGPFTDLVSIGDDLIIPEERYSDIDTLLLKNTETEEVFEIPLSVDNQKPFLTKEFINYIKDVYENIEYENSEIAWVPINDNSKNIPTLRTSISSDSMMEFVNTVTKFLVSGGLVKYKSAHEALAYFSEMVFSKVEVPLIQLEVILRAHMISSTYNYAIPVVEDMDNVMFAKTAKVIERRTISGQFAYQGLRKYLASPITYTEPRGNGPYDYYFGF